MKTASAQGRSYDLSTGAMLLFALPSIPLGLMSGPVGGILPSIYISHFGLSAAVVGLVTLIVRVFDAVTDPVIGYFSDRSTTRWGKRKPYIAVGVVVTCLSAYYVYFPPPDPSAAYFLISFSALYLGWTLAEIPLAAWAVEATGSTQARNRIFMLRWVMSSIGWLLVFAIPFLPVFSSSEMSPDTMRWVGGVALVLLPATVALALARVPRGAELAVREEGGLLPFVRAAMRNRPFQVYLVTAILSGLGTGVYFSLSFLFFTQVLGHVQGFAILGLLNVIVGIPAFYFWSVVSSRIGHVRMWSLCHFLVAASMLSMLVLPAGKEYFVVTAVLTCVIQFFASGWYIGAGPILGDAVDYDLLKTGVNRTGKYFALQALLGKATNGIGGGLGFALLSVIGYSAVQGAVNSEEAVRNFRYALVGVSEVALVLSGLIILLFPITLRRRRIIRARLETRAERAARATP